VKLWRSNAAAGESTGFLLLMLINVLARLLKYTAPVSQQSIEANKANLFLWNHMVAAFKECCKIK